MTYRPEEYFIKLINVSGKGITVYTDAKIPNGGRLMDAQGNQVFLQNEHKLVMVNPTQPILFDARPFLKFENNQLAYAKVWNYDEETKHGIDFVPGKETWIEVRGHIEEFKPEPEPEAGPIETEDITPEDAISALLLLAKFIKKNLG